MAKLPDCWLSRQAQIRLADFVSRLLKIRKRTTSPPLVSRSVLYEWRRGKHRTSKARAITVLKRLGVSWHQFTISGKVRREDPEVPVSIGIAWALTSVLARACGDRKATMTGTQDPDGSWIVTVETTQVTVSSTGWCELFLASKLACAGQYSPVFEQEVCRVLQIMRAPERQKRRKTEVRFSSLQTKLRALHDGT